MFSPPARTRLDFRNDPHQGITCRSPNCQWYFLMMESIEDPSIPPNPPATTHTGVARRRNVRADYHQAPTTNCQWYF